MQNSTWNGEKCENLKSLKFNKKNSEILKQHFEIFPYEEVGEF